MSTKGTATGAKRSYDIGSEAKPSTVIGTLAVDVKVKDLASPAIDNAATHIDYAEAKLINLQKNFEVGSASDAQCEAIKAHLTSARDLLKS